MTEHSVFLKHQLRIARETLKMTNSMADLLKRMTKQEAKELLYQHGFYSFPPPPVQTNKWDQQAWINFIDVEGKWR